MITKTDALAHLTDIKEYLEDRVNNEKSQWFDRDCAKLDIESLQMGIDAIKNQRG